MGPLRILVFVLLALTLRSSASAQDLPREWATLGAYVGVTSARSLWRSPYASRRTEAPTLGVFADARTSIDALSVLASAGLVRRGGEVYNERQDPDGLGATELSADYLTMSVLAKGRLQVGPLTGWIGVGPTLDILLRSNRSGVLNQVLERDHVTGGGATAGAGVDVEVTPTYRVGLELHATERLTTAFDGVAGDVRFRTFEAVVRIGRIVR